MKNIIVHVKYMLSQILSSRELDDFIPIFHSENQG